MKNLLAFVALCCFLLPVSARAERDYLVKVDGVNQAILDQMASTGIEVYAKAENFWVAGASSEDLLDLTKQGIAYQILDQEAGIGEHYLISAEPPRQLGLELEKVKARCRILFADEDIALVKGNSESIEELTAFGLELRKMHLRPLPLESAPPIPFYLQSLSLEYDPLIQGIVDQVDQAQLFSWVDKLTGEDTVTIGGVTDSIKTRYSWSDGVFKAANYLKERFGEMGVSVEFDTFQVGTPVAYFVDVACSPEAENAWSVSIGGGMVKTINGGDQWYVIEETDHLTLWDVCRVDDDTLWSVGTRGIIVRSTDGGDTWEDRSKPEFVDIDFRACCFQDADHGWVAGEEKILFTSDAGIGWIEQASLDSVALFDIDFVDSCRGWIVGENGTVLHTTNRGADWTFQASQTSVRLRSVAFVDRFNGWAVGDRGSVIHTTNGGLLWIPEAVPAQTTLNCINFVDSLHGWMVGLDGSIFYTSDLGADWIAQESNTSYLHGIEFADTLTGWAVGYNDIIKTTDGGQTWFSQYENVIQPHLFNVVGTIEGRFHPGRQFLITGHYDDESEDPFNWAPGADDNASGAVGLLAAARILKEYGLANTVKFVAFSGEEQGLLGSAAYAEQAFDRGDTILGVLNCDMIAYDGNGDRVMEVHSGSPPENQALADIMIGAISDYELDLVPQKITAGASYSSDHASFWSYGFPAILGHEDYQDWNPHLHSTQDRVSLFDSSYYVNFVKAAVATISILGDPFLFGDANRDGLVDLGDVVFLVNYLYRNGPAPEPGSAGDVNCDGTVDLGDVVYLTNYLFRGGTPPQC